MKPIHTIMIGAAVCVFAALYIFVGAGKSGMTEAPMQDVEPTAPSKAGEAVPVETIPVQSPTLRAAGIDLRVSSPVHQSTVKTAEVTVLGITAPGADVFANDMQTKAAADGSFSVRVPLEEGENYLLIVANDDAGNFSEYELTVTYTP